MSLPQPRDPPPPTLIDISHFRSRTYVDGIQGLHNTSLQLSSRPETSPAFLLRVYPLSLQRSALLVQHELEEHAALEAAQQMFDMERARVEDEYKRGRERVRERMLEGIEEKRRRAREERDGDALGDSAAGGALDAQTRPGATRKLRGKLASPPPQDMPQPAMGAATGAPSNPHSLAIDELPSAFPLPLTAVTLPQSGHQSGQGGAQGQNRRRAKGAGGAPQPAFGMLGKSVLSLAGCKESEIEADLSDITRGNKRRRTAAGGSGNK